MGCTSSRHMAYEPNQKRLKRFANGNCDIPDKRLYMDDENTIQKFNLREKQIFQDHGEKYVSSESKIDNIIPSRDHDAII